MGEIKMTLIVNIDGSHKGCGFYIPVLDVRESHLYSEYTPEEPTRQTNESEWEALLLALEYLDLKQWYDQSIEIRTDSKHIRNCATGKWKIKAENLIEYDLICHSLITKFKHLKIKWVPREFNQEADKLSKGVK